MWTSLNSNTNEIKPFFIPFSSKCVMNLEVSVYIDTLKKGKNELLVSHLNSQPFIGSIKSKLNNSTAAYEITGFKPSFSLNHIHGIPNLHGKT